MTINADAPASKQEVAAFYDDFSNRLLRDYVHGNPRFERAIERVLSCIGPNTKSVLDLGCGAGVSTMLIAESRPDVQITGVDISDENIRIAKSLNASSGANFLVTDLRDGQLVGSYDVIAMIDVHEHISRDSWPAFHASLDALLSPQGKLVITYPSEMHQKYLREHDPAGLQIIDEFICLDDLATLAQRIHAKLTLMEHVSIWHQYDYVHAIFDRSFDDRKSTARGGSLLQRIKNKCRSWGRQRRVNRLVAAGS